MAFPAAAAAIEDFGVTIRDERDPAPLGGQVVDHVTLVNVGDATADAYLDLLATKKGSDSATVNRFTRVDASQGSCPIVNFGHYTSAHCTVPQLAPGGRVDIVARLTARESMELDAALTSCWACSASDYADGGFSNNSASESTSVVGPTRISVFGLPRRCTSRDFTVRALATVTGLQLFRVLIDRRGQLWSTDRGSLRARVPARGLRSGRHKLTFVAERSEGPDVRRVFTFRRC